MKLNYATGDALYLKCGDILLKPRIGQRKGKKKGNDGFLQNSSSLALLFILALKCS